MKNIKLVFFASLAAVAILAFAIGCQQAPAPAPVQVQAPAPVQPMTFAASNVVKLNIADEVDTISTSSSLDTADYDLGTYSIPVNVGVQLTADSISGSTGATCYLQSRYRSSGGDKYWIDVPNATATINGVQTRAQITAAVLKGSVRCRCLAPSSTQNTRVYWSGFVTEDNP